MNIQTMQEITGAVINSDRVTNDLQQIDTAILACHDVEYISRDRARTMAMNNEHAGWNILAEAPALIVVVEGIRYRRGYIESPIDFPMTIPYEETMPAMAG